MSFKDKHPKHSYIFTDGSKQEKTIGCAAVYNGKTIQKHLPNDISIFNAEVCAVDMALDLIQKSKNQRFIIFFLLVVSVNIVTKQETWQPTYYKTLMWIRKKCQMTRKYDYVGFTRELVEMSKW